MHGLQDPHATNRKERWHDGLVEGGGGVRSMGATHVEQISHCTPIYHKAVVPRKKPVGQGMKNQERGSFERGNYLKVQLSRGGHLTRFPHAALRPIVDVVMRSDGG